MVEVRVLVIVLLVLVMYCHFEAGDAVTFCLQVWGKRLTTSGDGDGNGGSEVMKRVLVR